MQLYNISVDQCPCAYISNTYVQRIISRKLTVPNFVQCEQ